MARIKTGSTKTEIVRVATRMFLEKGFTNTSVKMISDELGISTGNLTFHFPSKWHLLSVTVEMLCDFRSKMMKQALQKGQTPLAAVCLELAAMASVCEENEIARDFYIQTYSHPLPLTILRKKGAVRAKAVFGQHCRGWTNEHFAEAQTLVSGMEFGTLMVTEDSADLQVRIAGALSCIMTLYGVPQEIRRAHIQRATKTDYRATAQRMFFEFIEYVESMDDKAMESYLKS